MPIRGSPIGVCALAANGPPPRRQAPQRARAGSFDRRASDFLPCRPTIARAWVRVSASSPLDHPGRGRSVRITDNAVTARRARVPRDRACCRASSAGRRVVWEPSQSGGATGAGFRSDGEHFFASPALRNARISARAVLYRSWYAIAFTKAPSAASLARVINCASCFSV
jgi:hypothetical protein